MMKMVYPSLQQMLSAGILGQSPVAHGFMQSLQHHHHHHHHHAGSHSLPYSTPLGPLSPYGPSSSSHHAGLPVSGTHTTHAHYSGTPCLYIQHTVKTSLKLRQSHLATHKGTTPMNILNCMYVHILAHTLTPSHPLSPHCSSTTCMRWDRQGATLPPPPHPPSTPVPPTPPTSTALLRGYRHRGCLVCLGHWGRFLHPLPNTPPWSVTHSIISVLETLRSCCNGGNSLVANMLKKWYIHLICR